MKSEGIILYKIQCLNNISPIGIARFSSKYLCDKDITAPDAILVRSFPMHDMEFGKELLAIARAGAGVNNIPIEKCSEQGIVVFNTPGANANAVKELVLTGLFLTSRKIVPALSWIQTLKEEENLSKIIEKGKSAFVGPEIRGKKLGVIGLGAIGILVANDARNLGMEVYGYDPYLSVDAAWALSRKIKHASTLDEIYQNCDYITVHVPLTPTTLEMINQEAISKMKDGVRLINFARGDLVNTTDLLEAINNQKVAAYITDFPTNEMIGNENIICIPHLGASTPEAEDNCAVMAAEEIMDYIENGNIKNSVNLPSVSLPHYPGGTRICIIHRNVPNTISYFAGIMAKNGVNIENMQSKSRKEFAYTLLDVTSDHLPEDLAEQLEHRDEIIRARIIQC